MSYFASPRFVEKFALHVVKNYLNLPQVPVPLILGIHGKKGEGKTFQCQLAIEQMGIEVIHISGGELESPDAGDPARLLRLRYREASERVKVRGRMVVLLINDLDAGAGRFDRLTQYTVNTQLVNATLMNIADRPTDVQLPGSYDSEPIRRIPIVVTGNDFGTLYAPLIRDGRMDKFYWEPTQAERVAIVTGILASLGLGEAAAAALVERFPSQSVDFFGAIVSRAYDSQVSQFIAQVGLENVSKRLINSVEPPPELAAPSVRLEELGAIGDSLVAEQDHIRELHLAATYNQRGDGSSGSSDNLAPPPPASPLPAAAPPAATNGSSTPPQGRSRPYAPAVAAPPPPTAAAFAENQPVSQPASQTDRLPDPLTVPPAIHALMNDPRFGSPLPNWRENELSSPPSPDPSAEPSGPAKPKLVQPLSPTLRSQLMPIVSNGYRLGIETADKRHYKANTWHCYATIEPHQEQTAIAQLETCLAEHLGSYVRLVAIDPQRKQRLRETIVHRPAS